MQEENRYLPELEVQQLEWERAEQARKLRWVEDSLRQALRDYDAENVAEPKIGLLNNTMPQFIKKCYAALEGNAAQAQHMVPEHTHSMAVTADNTITHDAGDV